MWMTPDGIAHTISVPAAAVPGLAQARSMHRENPIENRTDLESALDRAEDAEIDRLAGAAIDPVAERPFEAEGLPPSLLADLNWAALLEPSTVEKALALIEDRWRLDVIALLTEHF